MTRPPLIVLAGGKGTRLGDLTKDIPKPMVDIHGKPFLYWLIERYRSWGFTDITISTGYKAEVIENYPWPWPLEFLRDTQQSGPDFALARVDELNPFAWICNGDTWPMGYPPDDTNYPMIGIYDDVDSGLQLVGLAFGASRMKTFCCPFIDMGTREGLKYLRRHLTHLDKVSASVNILDKECEK